MNLSKILGQDHLKQQIVNFANNNKMPHALLLLENTNLGALSMAIAIAKLLHCTQAINGEACDNCQSCSMINKYAHPDLHFVFPVVKKGNKKRQDCFSDDFIQEWRASLTENLRYMHLSLWLDTIEAENKQANINTKECVEIIRKLSLKSYLQGPKVMIIWLPEYLGNNANRLLKLVEEPPENTYLIFVSANEELVMGTLQSRCQVLRLSPIPEVAMSEFLKNEHNVSNDDALRIARGVESDIVLARDLAFNKVDNVTDDILQWLRLCFLMKPDLLTKWIDEFHARNKTYQKYFLSQALGIMRTFVRMEAGERELHGVGHDDFEKLKGLSNVLDFNKIQSIALLLSESISFVPRNINVKIMMMADSIAIGDILRKKD